MRIIIKESQLENVIFKFLDLNLTPHKVVSFMVEDEEVVYWVKDEKVVAELELWRGVPTFWIDETIFNGIMGGFSLDYEQASNYVCKYIEKYHGLNGYACHKFSVVGPQRWYDEYKNQI